MSPQPMTEYAFPVHLLDVVKSRWKADPSDPKTRMPDTRVLQRLLDMCYYASFRTSEHRSVRCILAYVPMESLPSKMVLPFESPVSLTDRELVRLSPVTDRHRTFIGCDRMDGRIKIWGLFEQHYAWSRYTTSEPLDILAREVDLPPNCLTISIEEPGALRVARGRKDLVRLREGRVVLPQETPLRRRNRPLHMFFEQLVADMRDSEEYGDRMQIVKGKRDWRTMCDLFTTSVARILERIRARWHGGSVVVSRVPVHEKWAHVTYHVGEQIPLAEEIINYYKALKEFLEIPESPSTPTEELEKYRAEETLRRANQQLSRGISRVSLLASVDGAVLLGGNLGIDGFGVRFPILLSPGTVITDALAGIEHECDEWGLRHQSVFSFCQKNEEAVGFIVSQDGGVKAVKSIDGMLHLWNEILD